MTDIDLPKIKEAVEATLRERCGDVFELIAVRPDFNGYGDEILVIKAVFNQDRLSAQRTSGLIRHLRAKLAEAARKRFRLSRLSPNLNCGTVTLKPFDPIETARDRPDLIGAYKKDVCSPQLSPGDCLDFEIGYLKLNLQRCSDAGDHQRQTAPRATPGFR